MTITLTKEQAEIILTTLEWSKFAEDVEPLDDEEKLFNEKIDQIENKIQIAIVEDSRRIKMTYEEAYKQQQKYIESKFNDYKGVVDSYGEDNIPNDVMARWFLIREIKKSFDEINELTQMDDIIES